MARTNTLKLIFGSVITGANYDFWSIKMNTFLQLNKCWDMVETNFKEPNTNAMATLSNSQKNVIEAR